MEEKQGKKLLKLLNKWGVSAEEAQEFLEDYDNTPDEEEVLEETNVDEVDAEPDVEEELDSTEAPSEETPAEEPQPSEPVEEVNEDVEEVTDELEPTPSEDVEPVEPVEEPIEEPTDTPIEPMEEEVAEPIDQPMEQPNDAKYNELLNNYNELKETVDGLNAKITALQENLSKSGMFDFVQEPPIGIDENVAPSTGVASNTQSILDRLNKGRNY